MAAADPAANSGATDRIPRCRAWVRELDAELAEPFDTAAGLVRITDIAVGVGVAGRLPGRNSCVSAVTVAITTAHEETHLGFCYADPVLSRARAEAFADAVLTALARRPDPSAALQAGA
ncbi:hypothetical protein ACFV4K_21115 [Nocardia sp. NPDC059764]|uniref:hypothetical protein n=1 Tax=Nocardia sp. NPDC059764 TaxID=3346939 RepID=UPI0036553043